MSQTCLNCLKLKDDEILSNLRTKRKMQGGHKKLFLGSLRASRAIKKGHGPKHPPLGCNFGPRLK